MSDQSNMEIRFWGVRGSISSPGPATKHYGGHTSCISVTKGNHTVIFDGGGGLRKLGLQLNTGNQRVYQLFLTHCHFDHMSGLPFFAPLYDDKAIIHIYGPKGNVRNLRRIMHSFFAAEFFPVPFHRIPAKLVFHALGEDKKRVAGYDIRSFPLNHPGRTVGYTLATPQVRFAYVTDHEPIHEYRHIRSMRPHHYEQKLWSHLQDLDLLVHDAHFLDEQYPRYRGWGHSPWSYPVSLAEKVKAKHLVLFHYAPDNDDNMLRVALRNLQHDLKKQKSQLRVTLAREGESITL